MLAGVYQHFKGKHYQVLGIAQNAANPSSNERFVVYVALYEADGPRMFVRKVDEFEETVELPDGSTAPRFRYVGVQL